MLRMFSVSSDLVRHPVVRLAGLGVALAVSGAVAIACGASSSREGFGDNQTPTDGSDAGSGAPGGGGFGGDAQAPATDDGCSEEAKLIYVLSLEGDLYSFAPAKKEFTKIGPLNCSVNGKKLTPIAMAVDRKAVAWVNMRESSLIPTEDTLYKVDTKTAACTPSNVKAFMGGMSFSTDQGTKDKETLFVISEGNDPEKAGLHRVDFDQEKLVYVTDIQDSVDLELTGTGDGKLFGFLIANPLALAQVDKGAGSLSGRATLTGVLRPQAPMFAFSFWGGDFYFYTANSTSASKTTTVARYRPSDGNIEASYMQNIGFHIVGAGVSTCAPLTVK